MSIPLCNIRTYVKYLERIERTVFGRGPEAASPSACAEPFVTHSATRPVAGSEQTRALQKAMFPPDQKQLEIHILGIVRH